jgi:iron complex outermembrane receptor protein
LTLGVTGSNLLDEEVRNHVSFKKDEVLLPGASVKTFVRMRLN